MDKRPGKRTERRVGVQAVAASFGEAQTQETKFRCRTASDDTELLSGVTEIAADMAFGSFVQSIKEQLRFEAETTV